MNLYFFCPHWGSEHLPLRTFMEQVKNAGYDGVEMNIPFDPAFGEELQELLAEFELKLIAQQYLEPQVETPAAYKERMVNYLEHLASFAPLAIDAHTGRDHYDFETNCEMIEAAETVGQKFGLPIWHETHRGRFTFSAHGLQPFLDKYPEMKITADFSHWVNVAESYLEDQAANVSRAIKHANHIHARVGHTEGPQVTHPGAPEWQEALNHHLAWWDQIIALQKENNREWFSISPEFGAIPYLPTLPFTNQQVVSQWEVNVFMKDLLKTRYQDS